MRKSQDPLTISDPAAALALTNARARSILFALMRQTSSLKNLHDQLGLSLSLLHYHVARLRRCGLVKVERVEARAGRPITIYAPAAKSFIVPSHLVGLNRSSNLRVALNEALERNLSRYPPETILYDLDEDRSPRMRRISGSDTPTCGEWWSRLRLTDRQSAELVTEMKKLISRYRSEGASRRKPYLLYLAVAQTA